MSAFPGHRPMQGDTLHLTTDTAVYRIDGEIVVQGVVRDGQGHVTLTLPATNEEQLRDLTQSAAYLFELYADGVRLYTSPGLKAVETKSADGVLVVTGSLA